ncbi:FecCD family ABC transporter permease [Agromyces larvae]|uniref:Iron chelate uptake ABC transporter family permease subunit n=1 Tax=Agromyces larvae TaxID=2929802 RepID=A0ABY4BWU3_9MICO|nr:iron chelate uptake ABC transporter family permease subunit [Agromyces larvae]UOE43229.1 iron chelate uptake ABC transporter family permease subunit [Agromyces larvae]
MAHPIPAHSTPADLADQEFRAEPRHSGGAVVWRSRGERVSLRWRLRPAIVAGVLIVLLVPLGVGVLTTGSMPLAPADIWAALIGQGEGPAVRVIEGIRMPRLVAGVVVGAALGVSGAVFQAVSRNPLGSPDIIGFVSGSATGAIVAIIVFDAPARIVAASAVVAGLVVALVVGALTLRHGSGAGYRLVLVGIGAGAFLGAVNDLLLTRSQRDEAVGAQQWLVGTLNARGWEEVLPTIVAVVVLLPALVVLRSRLVMLDLGDDAARQIGVPLGSLRVTSIAIAVVLAAFATATAGPISFVALAAPQLVMRVGRSGTLSIVGSAAMGAVLLVTSDLVSQHLPLALAAPVGIVTAMLGGVYLLWLLSRGR